MFWSIARQPGNKSVRQKKRKAGERGDAIHRLIVCFNNRTLSQKLNVWFQFDLNKSTILIRVQFVALQPITVSTLKNHNFVCFTILIF